MIGGKRKWCRARVSNPRPADYKSAALPTELARRPAYSTRSPPAAKRPACSCEGGGAAPPVRGDRRGWDDTKPYFSIFSHSILAVSPEEGKTSSQGLVIRKKQYKYKKRTQNRRRSTRGRFCGAFFCFGRPASPEPGSCRACSVPGADPAHRTGAPAIGGGRRNPKGDTTRDRPSPPTGLRAGDAPRPSRAGAGNQAREPRRRRRAPPPARDTRETGSLPPSSPPRRRRPG